MEHYPKANVDEADMYMTILRRWNYAQGEFSPVPATKDKTIVSGQDSRIVLDNPSPIGRC